MRSRECRASLQLEDWISPLPESSSPALLCGAWGGEVDRESALYINLVLINQEYGLYPFKQLSYFSLAN